MSTIWRVTFHSQLAHDAEAIEALACELVDLGALGTTISSARSIECFFEDNDEEHLRENLSKLPLNGLCLANIETVPSANWSSLCAELMQPLHIGDLSVQPISSSAEGVRSSQGVIQIIPGLGFGTGHHETTASCLSMLQHSAINKSYIRRALDLGTGSGILAIAAAKLFSCSVDACDTDEAAILNASENSSINETSDKVRLNAGSIELYDGEYDLVMANLYAEILINLSKGIANLVKVGGFLILSGILESRYKNIMQSFNSDHFNLIDSSEERGWVTLLLKRRAPLEN